MDDCGVRTGYRTGRTIDEILFMTVETPIPDPLKTLISSGQDQYSGIIPVLKCRPFFVES